MIEFLAYCRTKGLLLQIRNDTLLVSPAAKLLPEDAAFIRANKPAIIVELRAVGCGCPGVCPGGTSELCCGAPDPVIELRFPNGEIAPQWCSDGMDAKATHWRRRGDTQWTKIERTNHANNLQPV